MLCRKLPDKARRDHPLIDIQKRSHLIKEVKVRLLRKSHRQRDPLKFSARKIRQILIEDRIKGQLLRVVIEHLPLIILFQKGSDRPLERLWDKVDILRFDRRPDRLCGDLLEIIQQLRSRIMLQDLRPLNFMIEDTQIRAKLSGKDLHRGGFPDTVRA